MKEIKLSQGRVSLVDDEDFEWLRQWKWHAHKQTNGAYRACRMDHINEKIIIMARVIMGAKDSEFVDHKDRDGLNNQRSNLRLCTKHQNNFNKSVARNSTSKYLGVCLDKKWGKWRATITLNYKQYSIGRFDSEVEAAIAYNNKAKELFGEFANLNEV